MGAEVVTSLLNPTFSQRGCQWEIRNVNTCFLNTSAKARKSVSSPGTRLGSENRTQGTIGVQEGGAVKLRQGCERGEDIKAFGEGCKGIAKKGTNWAADRVKEQLQVMIWTDTRKRSLRKDLDPAEAVRSRITDAIIFGQTDSQGTLKTSALQLKSPSCSVGQPGWAGQVVWGRCLRPVTQGIRAVQIRICQQGWRDKAKQPTKLQVPICRQYWVTWLTRDGSQSSLYEGVDMPCNERDLPMSVSSRAPPSIGSAKEPQAARSANSAQEKNSHKRLKMRRSADRDQAGHIRLDMAQRGG
ncbi:hypothetical protein C8R44DRAFT_747173 [Mycena epipterygia]|nr:hypothetical protein C8R44DRAFT_747173 [Mycena epipterygia]